MKLREDKQNNTSLDRSPLVIGLIMTVLVFLLPFGYRLDLGPGPDSVIALIWDYIEAPWQSGFGFVNFGIFLTSIIYTFPRFIFLYRMIQYYSFKIPRSSVIKTGIISEFFPVLVSIILIIGWQLGWTQPPPPIDHWFPIYIPFPALLGIGLGFVFLLPPIQSTSEDAPSQKNL